MDALARAMADIAEEMAAAEGLAATSLVAAQGARRMIPGVDEASISLAKRAVGITTVASTGPLPDQADAAQVSSHQGPCIEVAWDDRVARLPDSATDEQWPVFSRRAHDLGVGSMLCFQLSLDETFEEERIGALNTYSRSPHAYTQESERIGLILAVHISVAVAFAERHDQMQEALAGRDLIGQAKGIIMASQGVDAETAFDLLVRRSRESNTRLRDVAAEVVRPGAVTQRQRV